LPIQPDARALMLSLQGDAEASGAAVQCRTPFVEANPRSG